MFKKLSLRISGYIVLLLVLVSGSVSAIYISNSKSLYISREKELMTSAYKGIFKYDFETEKRKIDNYLDKYDDQVYSIVICNSERKTVYSSRKRPRTEKIKDNKIIGDIYSFSENAEPIHENPPKGIEKLILRRIVNHNGHTFYVYIEESLRTIDSVFDYTNTFLFYMIVLFVVVCGVGVFLFVNGATKPARKLSLIAGQIADKNYSIRYTGKITDDEIGVLAKNLNNMADTIQESINNLKNYNFLLKEDVARMSEYETMRKRVLCNVTHELKTPLAIISSQVEMIKCSSDEKKKEYYYESAMDEIDKMSKLISRFLNFSAGEKEVFKAKEVSLNLSDEISELCKTISVFVENKHIAISKQIDNNCILKIAPNHIEHILNNYLMNAVGHVSYGGKIKVSLKKLEDRFRLTVYNDGNKIEEENMKKIWTDFYKFNQKQQGLMERSGLGLFIVKEISIIDHSECGVRNCKNGVEFWYDFISQ